MSHTTRIGNFSVASVEFGVAQGTNIVDTQSTAVLTLVPDPGFTLTAADFSYTSGPAQVEDVAFTQSGDNVLATVTFAAGATMPASNLDIPICIAGESGLVQYTLSGVVETIASSNVTPASGNTSFSISGNEGDDTQAFSHTVTAGSGYYFPTSPSGSLTTGDANNYSFTTSETTNDDSQITAKTFTGVYTFPAANVANNVFTVVAEAVEIPVIVREITSYSIITSNINPAGETRAMTIFGTEGAQFSLTAVNEDGTSVLSNPLTNITIPATGAYSFNITFPTVTDSDDYVFTLTGDLAATFNTPEGQPSTFTLNQYIDIYLTFQLTTVNTDLTVGNAVVINYPGDTDLELGDVNYNFTGELIVTSTSPITENTAPLASSFTNLVAANNGGTDITITSVDSALSNSDLTYTITFEGTTERTGTINVLSEIDLEFLISTNTPPVAAATSYTVIEDTGKELALSATDADGDALVYTIQSGAANGTFYVSSGGNEITSYPHTLASNTVWYVPDLNYNGVDIFQIKVYDGSAYSSVVTNAIQVTPVNDAPAATPQAVSLLKGETETITLAGTDVDGDSLSYIIDSLPANGTLYTDAAKTDPIVLGELPHTLANNVVYYEHDDSSALTDAFNFKVNDGTVDSPAAAITISIGVSVGSSISTRGSAGVYYVPIILGTAAGTFKVHFNAYGLPDRLRILFDTNGISNELSDMEVVADSLWIGDNLFQLPQDNDAANGTYVVGEYTYVGSGGNAPSSDFNTADDPAAAADQWDKDSNSTSITISDDVVCNITSFRSGADTAISNGQSRGPATPGGTDYGNQIGAQNGVYENESATTLTTGLRHADGNICLTYTKPETTSAFTAYLKIEGKGNTGWDIWLTEFV